MGELDSLFPAGSVLLVTSSYPSEDDLYRGAFIHRRIKHYIENNTDIVVFDTNNTQLSYDHYDGVNVVRGTQDELADVLRVYSNNINLVLVHFITSSLYRLLCRFFRSNEMVIWIHGYEARDYRRLSFNYSKQYLLLNARLLQKANNTRMALMREIIPLESLRKIFVSNFMMNIAIEDSGSTHIASCQVVPNFIDATLFPYRIKTKEQRFHILCIRPFTTLNYGYDLIQRSLLLLVGRPYFDQLTISVFGFGDNFNKTMKPLAKYKNIKITNKVLTQEEIADEHARHGILLHPTRFDTQGVSMGEGMSSGLVVVTNKVAAISEYADEKCAMLANSEDTIDLVSKIDQLIEDGSLFQTLSKNASARVSDQCGVSATVEKELKLIIGV